MQNLMLKKKSLRKSNILEACQTLKILGMSISSHIISFRLNFSVYFRFNFLFGLISFTSFLLLIMRSQSFWIMWIVASTAAFYYCWSYTAMMFLPNPLPSGNGKFPCASKPMSYPKYFYVSKPAFLVDLTAPNNYLPNVKLPLYVWPQIYLVHSINIYYITMVKCEFILF